MTYLFLDRGGDRGYTTLCSWSLVMVFMLSGLSTLELLLQIRQSDNIPGNLPRNSNPINVPRMSYLRAQNATSTRHPEKRVVSATVIVEWACCAQP